MNTFGYKQNLFHIKLASGRILGKMTVSRPHNRLLWAVGMTGRKLSAGGKTYRSLRFIEQPLAKTFSGNYYYGYR